MSRYNTPLDRDWKDILAQIAVAVVGIFVVVWFLPRDDRSIMHFEVNRPWPYGQLIAPYDFYVFKSEAQLQAERDSIRELYEPYYQVNPAVEVDQLRAFNNSCRQGTTALPYSYRVFFEKQLHEVYERGIIGTDDLQLLSKDDCNNIYIYSGTEATLRSVADLYTQKSAYEYLMAQADSSGLQRAMFQHLNINQFIQDNLDYDAEKSAAAWDELQSSLVTSSGMILAGQNIIERGAVVTRQDSVILRSFERAVREHSNFSRNNHTVLLGEIIYVAVIIICLIIFFDMFRRDYTSNLRSVLLLAVLILSFPLITSALVRHTLLSVYLVPYAMLPVFVRVFMDSRTAFFTHVCTILLCALSLRYPFEFIATQLMAGLAAIYTLRELSERSQLFRTVLFTTLVSLLVYLSIDLVHGRTFTGDNTVTVIDYAIYKHIIISGALLLFAYPLMYLLERLFGFTSNVTLVELSNVNRPLLRRLSEVAPGTFQHSMMVSNLAAEVANRIGAKAQLVRTGALYHDIGKIVNPEYFTENQLGGANPHSRLSNSESAAIILRHVTDGLEMADRYELPRIIREFICTHHGTGMAKFFYITEQNAHPDEKIDPAKFSYVGPNPHTTEQAILMMCDAVEASARSLKDYTEENIGQLVDNIIDTQVADGFFRQCPITFLDIQTTKDVLKDRLKTIYHTRVSYPTLDKNKEKH
ncbi:MAG: HDIG domain-containing protein [Bacteroidales bacterium]|nr:HDIG domain-containing protein [Bacteroidales bacterium]